MELSILIVDKPEPLPVMFFSILLLLRWNMTYVPKAGKVDNGGGDGTDLAANLLSVFLQDTFLPVVPGAALACCLKQGTQTLFLWWHSQLIDCCPQSPTCHPLKPGHLTYACTQESTAESALLLIFGWHHINAASRVCASPLRFAGEGLVSPVFSCLLTPCVGCPSAS